MDTHREQLCKNCGQQLKGPICHNCGQRQFWERWSMPVLVQQLINQLTNIEKGFLYTSKMLFAAPGKLIHDYWRGKTIVYYNPFRYLIIWTTINLLISFWLGIDDMLQDLLQPDDLVIDFTDERIQSADQQFDSWMNVLVLLIIPVVSAMTYWLFKKRKANYAEHLIMNSFVFGQHALISSFTQFIYYFFPKLISGFLISSFLIDLVYNVWVYKTTFSEPWGATILKAIATAAVGFITFFVLVILFSMVALMLS